MPTTEIALLAECLRRKGTGEETIRTVLRSMHSLAAIAHLAERLLINPRMSEGELLRVAAEGIA